MRARKLGRRVGRVVAIAALGVGMTAGAVSGIAAGEVVSDDSEAPAEVLTGTDASPDEYHWE